MNRRAAVAALVVLAAATAAGGRAEAVEREHQVGVDAGGSMLVIQDKSTSDVGSMLGLHYSYGLTDAFNLMVEGAWSLVAVNQELDHPDTPHTRPASVYNVDVGIGYVLDVLQWVPYAGLLVGGYALQGGTVDGLKVLPGAEIALGLDYRFDRSWAAGVAFRQHLMSETATYPSFTQAFARLEYTWGW